MGVSVFDVNIATQEKFQLLYMNTIKGDKLLFDIPIQFDDMAATGILARTYALARSLTQLIVLFEPDMGIIEDNFLGANPSTFKQLIQAVYMLRDAFVKKGVHVSYVLPRPAKAVVGADFDGSTKEDVLKGLMEYPYMEVGDIDLSVVDDHSSDSGVIGLYRCEQIASHYGVLPNDHNKK